MEEWAAEGFSVIRTLIIGGEGEHADHKNPTRRTTKTQVLLQWSAPTSAADKIQVDLT